MAALSPPPGFSGRFLTDERTRAAYSEGAGPYRIVPRAVARPASRQDVAVLLRWAAGEGVPVTPRGAGSGMPGGNVGEGVVLDLLALDRPCRVSLQSIANVGAAVTWKTLDDVAGHFGFRLPPDPSSGAFCTVGGMVATNAAGARSVRAGSIRPWVRGVEFVTTDGEAGWLPRSEAARTTRAPTPRTLVDHLAVEKRFSPVATALRDAGAHVRERFPATRKNASGYALDAWLSSGDLVDLVIGAEGTLGVVTRIELDLERRPERAGTLLIGLSGPDVLEEVVPQILLSDPSAVEFLDGTFLRFASEEIEPALEGADAALIVEVEGATAEEVKARLDTIRTRTAGHVVVVHEGLSADERQRLWQVRHAASPALARLEDGRRSLQIIEDGCVPVDALGRYIAGVRAAARRAGVDIVAFGHAGDGHLHVNVLVDPDRPDLIGRLEALLLETTELLAGLGGTLSGEHGDGRLRARALERIYGAEVVALFQRVKDAFDPAGVLNPGIIVGTGGPPLRRLKVGPGAAAIPDDVADALRRIEQTAAWGVRRDAAAAPAEGETP